MQPMDGMQLSAYTMIGGVTVLINTVVGISLQSYTVPIRAGLFYLMSEDGSGIIFEKDRETVVGFDEVPEMAH